MKKDNEEFKVTDKRIFDQKGELKKELKRKKTSKAAAKKSAEQEKKTNSKIPEEKNDQAPQQSTAIMPDFDSFILSLSTSAYIYLGILKDPISKENKMNLEAAKQMIDILAMLKEKTKGNLLSNEEKLLDDVLYDLRMQYLNKSNAIKT